MFGMSPRDRADMIDIRRTAERALNELATHQQVCAERQGELREQVRAVQKLQWAMASATILTLIGIVVQFFEHSVGLK